MMASGIELATAYVSLVADTKSLSRQINSAFDDAARDAARSGSKIGKNLDTSIGQGLGGSKNAAAKAGADAAKAYERALQSSVRGEKIGNAIGTVIGKGIGLGITAGVGVAAAGATAAVGLLATSLTKGFARLKNIDNAKFKLQALGNSAADVKAIMDSAQKSVKGTAFGLDAAANTAATATAAGVPTGQSLTDYLTNVADAAAIAQTSLDDMGSIFNKVQTNGKAMTDDLQMLADRGLPIFTWLQKQYGVSGDALQKMVEDGKVSAADFQRAVHDNIAGSAKKMGESFEGALQNLDAALGRLGATILGVPFDNASGGIGAITDSLDKLNGWLGQHQSEMIGFWAALADAALSGTKGVVKDIALMVEAWAQFQNAIGDILGGLYKADAAVNRLLGQTDLANERDKMAEDFFSWGTSAHEAAENLMKVADSLDANKQALDKWKDQAKAAATLTSALGDSFKEVNDNGHIVVESNAMDKLTELNDLGVVVKNLPDGSFEVVAGTPAAQALIDAFVSKNRTLPPATQPVELDTERAKLALQQLRDQISNTPPGFTPGVAPPASASPGGNAQMPVAPSGLPVPFQTPGYVPYDPGAWKRPPFGGGRAGGGPIGGFGPKGKDSTLIMAAPGEHMLTAGEVDMLGGQGGAYALRAAIRAGQIPGFAGGGAIKRGVVIYPPEPVGPTDKTRAGGVPDLNPGHSPNQIATPDWSTPGQGFGEPPPNWWGRPINPEDRLFPDWIPPGLREYWKQPGKKRIRPAAAGIPGFEGGGAIPAIDYAYSNAGQSYNYGAFDCSMFMSQIYARMAGLPPGRYFTTDSDFAALGFKRGYKPGALNIGTNGGVGENGHMAGTLPNGINVENAGSLGSMYGAGAKGANDFGQQWYYEAPNAGDMGAMQTHGMSAGLPPGPVGADGQPVTPGGGATPTDSGRTEGYIPAGAGNASVAGTSFVSGLYNMGAEAINGLIDQAASAASSAVGVAAFGTPGAAQGAAAAIGLGTQAAKRGVSYGFQMLGIGTDALLEQLTPFGAPRWLSTDPTAFMPQGLTQGLMPGRQEPGQPGQAPPMPPEGQHTGTGALPGPAPAGMAPPTAPQSPQQNDWWHNLFSFDQGGVLEPGMVGKNFSSRPEYVFTEDQMAELTPTAGRNAPLVGTLQALDMDDAMRKLTTVQRRDALQYQGRP